jgi:hypothetical protein
MCGKCLKEGMNDIFVPRRRPQQQVPPPPPPPPPPLAAHEWWQLYAKENLSLLLPLYQQQQRLRQRLRQQLLLHADRYGNTPYRLFSVLQPVVDGILQPKSCVVVLTENLFPDVATWTFATLFKQLFDGGYAVHLVVINRRIVCDHSKADSMHEIAAKISNVVKSYNSIDVILVANALNYTHELLSVLSVGAVVLLHPNHIDAKRITLRGKLESTYVEVDSCGKCGTFRSHMLRKVSAYSIC